MTAEVRQLVLLRSLRCLAASWTMLRLHSVADANCVAAAAAQLLKLPDLASLSDEDLERNFEPLLGARASVFLAIIDLFDAPRGGRTPRAGKPPAPAAALPEEPEKPF